MSNTTTPATDLLPGSSLSLGVLVCVLVLIICYWIFCLPRCAASNPINLLNRASKGKTMSHLATDDDVEAASLLGRDAHNQKEKNTPIKKSRSWILDNAKFVVMCHVLLGHFLLTSTSKDPSSTGDHVIRNWFKAWHDYSLSFQITVFAFISGAVSKRSGDVTKSTRKLLIFVGGPMFLMYTFLYLTYTVWMPKHNTIGSPYNPVSFGASDWPVTPLWYLASLISWRLMLLMFGSMANELLLPFSVLLSLAGGYWGGIGSDEISKMVHDVAKQSTVTDQIVLRSNTVMAFERTLGNYPFFMAGVVCWPMLNAWLTTVTRRFQDKQKWLVPIVGAVFAAVLACVVCATTISTSAYMIYGKYYQTNYLSGWLRQYGDLPSKLEWNLIWTRRALYIIVSPILGMCNTLWLPTFKVPWISESGAHSVYPYVLQVTALTLWTQVRDALDIKKISQTSGGWWTIIFLAQPLVILLLSSRVVRFLFWPLVEPYWLNAFMADRNKLPWKHPELELFWEKNTRMHVFRIVFWIVMVVATFSKLLTPVRWFSAHQ